MQSEPTKLTDTVQMPRELATRLIFDDCYRYLAEREYNEALRIANMLGWLRTVYCKGMPSIRIMETEHWALEIAEIGGVELVWLALKKRIAETRRNDYVID